MQRKLLVLMATLIIFVLFTQIALAEEAQPLKIDWIEGPAQVDVGENLAQLKLPEDYIFANGNDTRKIMEYYGNPISNKEVGTVFPIDSQLTWYILFEYNPLGYVKDDEAANLDPNQILEWIKKGTDEGNQEREKMGIPPIEVLGWEESPHYDPVTNNLVWAILAESEGEKLINYNMRILGRYGMTTVTLVANPSELATVKPELMKIINTYSYKEGSKYSDFIPGKDKVAEVGLTALIAGGAGAAATKAGLLAKILLIFKKLWILVAAGVFALFSRIRSSLSSKKREKQKEEHIVEMTEEVTEGQTEKAAMELTAEEALVEREG